MNGFWGADTEALRTMGAVCARRADVLDELEGRLSATLDGVEWTGEDAERFRADWAGIVRPGLQDRGVELRQQARRLAQHAEEQEAVSSPDSVGGPWSSPGAFLADMARAAEGALRDLLDGGAGGAGAADGAAGRVAELLREALSTPEGRAAFLGAFLGSLLGGLLADLLQRGLALGMLLEELLAGLGAGGGAGPGIGEVIGEDGRLGEAGGSGTSGGAEGGSGAGSDAGSGGSAGSEAAGGGGGAENGSGSGGGGSSSGGGSGSDGSADGGGADGGGADGRSSGLQGLVDGPAQAPGTSSSGRLDLGGDEEPGTLFERLVAMIGEMLGGAPGSGGAASTRGSSAIGEGIGWS